MYKKLFMPATIFQSILFIGTLNLFLIGLWGYDGSGGVVDNMYIMQIFYVILAFFSSYIIVLIASPLSLICCITAIVYMLRFLFKKEKCPSLIMFITFFIMTVINTCIYTLGALIYTNYSWFA